MEKIETDVDKIAELAALAATPRTLVTAGGREFMIVPEGLKATEVTDPHNLTPGVPARVKAGVTVQTEESLRDYLDRFKTPETVLFADIAGNAITGVIDYHAPSDAVAGLAGPAGNGDHRVTLTLPFSEEWKAWQAIDGKLLGQLEFARFIEENRDDIAAPSGADLLDVCRDLQGIRNVSFQKAVRTDSDNESFHYSDVTDVKSKATGKTVDVPTEFKLNIPVYFGGHLCEVIANLRWKMSDGDLTLGVKLRRAEHVRHGEFQSIVSAVGQYVERPAVFGRP